MKCMHIFIALLLSRSLVQVSYCIQQTIDPKFTAAAIAEGIIKEKQTENVSSKSEIDKNPNDYIILSSDQLKESTGAKGEEYYPGANAKYEEPTGGHASLGKSFNYYKKDPKPYYGFSKTDYRIVSETNTGIQVPVEYKDLDDIQGTQNHLDSLKDKLAKLKQAESTPNREYVGNAAVYEKDPQAYYDPLKNVHKQKEEYLKGVISQVEGMLNNNIETREVKYSRVKVGEVIYQNTQNKEAELYNEALDKLRPPASINARKAAVPSPGYNTKKKQLKINDPKKEIVTEHDPIPTNSATADPSNSVIPPSNASESLSKTSINKKNSNTEVNKPNSKK